MEAKLILVQLVKQIAEYLMLAGKNSLFQLIFLFGPIIILAFFINYLSLLNNRILNRILGTQGYLMLFGWLGVPVHETGHALFALVFGHQIKEMKLFRPDPKEGTLGFVLHTYNPRNLFHQVGNFFIGIGPIFLGAFVLLALSWFLFRINMVELPIFRYSTSMLSSPELIKTGIASWYEGIETYFVLTVREENSSWWRMVLYVYALLAVGSAIKLSWSDISGAFYGFLFIVLFFLVFNLATSWIESFSGLWLQKVEPYFSGLLFILMLSLVANLVFLPVLVLVFLIKKATLPEKVSSAKRR